MLTRFSMNKLVILLLLDLAVLFLILTDGVYSAVLHVPEDHATIQEAVNFAVDDDIVLVADGIYTGSGNKEIDLRGKSIVVRSENGPESTIIDCENEGRGFNLHRGEGPTSEIRGFTIINGSTDRGGAIRCHQSSPTIAENVISKNISGYGGGICLEESQALITNNSIRDNEAKTQGGGIYCGFSSPLIKNNIVADNTGRANGGGIGCRSSSPEIEANDIIENMTALCGGGIYSEDNSSLTVVNNLIVDNSTFRGGGIYCWGNCDLFIINNTVVENEAGFGGGIYLKQSCSLEVVNSIFWKNSPDQFDIDASSGETVSYSDVEGGWEGEGNIDAEPMFVDTENGDYHLQKDSPCLSNANKEDAPSKDKELNDRPLGNGFDMGCYEQARSGQFQIYFKCKLPSIWGQLKLDMPNQF